MYFGAASSQSNAASQPPAIAPLGVGQDGGNSANATPRTAAGVAPNKSPLPTPAIAVVPVPAAPVTTATPAINGVVVPTEVAPATVTVAVPTPDVVIPAAPAPMYNVVVPNNSSALTAKGAENNGPLVYGTANSINSSKALASQEKLRKIIDDNYQIRKSQLEKALANASPDARPAIRQAIADSESEYAKAIENLNQSSSNNTQKNTPGNSGTQNNLNNK